MIVLYFLAAFLLLYLIQLAIMIVAVQAPRDVISESRSPFVSVVIAARDEEHNLTACLESAMRQTCDQDSFEVIVQATTSPFPGRYV